MIHKYEFFHGAVLTRLIHDSDIGLRINQYNYADNNASYVVNDKVGLYIKHSTNRLSPWTFTFHKEHQDEIQEMKRKLSDVFIVLVCNDDGVVCLSFEELKKALDDYHKTAEWVRVARRPRQKYGVTGSDGKLKTKIGENEFPKKLLKVAKRK